MVILWSQEIALFPYRVALVVDFSSPLKFRLCSGKHYSAPDYVAQGVSGNGDLNLLFCFLAKHLGGYQICAALGRQEQSMANCRDRKTHFREVSLI